MAGAIGSESVDDAIGLERKNQGVYLKPKRHCCSFGRKEEPRRERVGATGVFGFSWGVGSRKGSESPLHPILK